MLDFRLGSIAPASSNANNAVAPAIAKKALAAGTSIPVVGKNRKSAAASTQNNNSFALNSKGVQTPVDNDQTLIGSDMQKGGAEHQTAMAYTAQTSIDNSNAIEYTKNHMNRFKNQNMSPMLHKEGSYKHGKSKFNYRRHKRDTSNQSSLTLHTVTLVEGGCTQNNIILTPNKSQTHQLQ